MISVWQASCIVIGRGGNRIKAWRNQTKRRKNQEISRNVTMWTGHLTSAELREQRSESGGSDNWTVFSKGSLSWTNYGTWKDRHRSTEKWNRETQQLSMCCRTWGRARDRGQGKGMEEKASSCQSYKGSLWQPLLLQKSPLPASLTQAPVSRSRVPGGREPPLQLKTCLWWTVSVIFR